MSTEPQPQYDDDDDVSSELTGLFLKQADFQEEERKYFVIQHATKEHFDAKNNRPAADQWVLTFTGDPERKLGLNKTNLALMAKWHGKRPSGWVGQAIIVWRDPSITFGGRLVGGLRLKKPTARELGAGDVDVPF